MKKNKDIFYGVLFGILMLFLFASMIQQHCSLFTFRKLSGFEAPTPKPKFTLKDYKSGDYQYDLEQYISENIGFREPIIRMYNQYVYDCYKKTYSREVAIEKDGWFYHNDGLNQYFGRMNEKYKVDNETFAKRLDVEMRCLRKVREILKEYDVNLMVFTLPTKTYLFPQHLKAHPFIDTTFNATKYYETGLTARDVPYINMNSWLQAVQDTTPFALFPQKGSHWAAGAPLAIDTMLRMMEHIGGQNLVELELGQPYPVYNVPVTDKDLEMLLNLWRPQLNDPVIEYPVNLKVADSTAFPSVLFVGTSFYWYMKRRVDFDELFRTRDFLYYGSYLYTQQEQVMGEKNDFDMLWELLSHDYVVYFKNGPQLYMDGFFFASRALINLCINDKRFREKQNEVANSLKTAYGSHDPDNKAYLYEARTVLWRNPELFEELRGEEVPSFRNPKVQMVLTKRNIFADARQKAMLEAMATNDSIDFMTVLAKETERRVNGTPSLLSQRYQNSYDFFDVETKVMMDSLWHQPQLIDSLMKSLPDDHSRFDLLLFDKARELVQRRVEQGCYDHDSLAIKAFTMQRTLTNMNNANSLANLKEKAKQQGKTLEKTIYDDAVWLMKNHKVSFDIDHEQIVALWQQYLIEHQFKTNPKSMYRIRQKAIDKDKPVIFAIMDDVLYRYREITK